MIDPKLIEILCCPETKQDVTIADSKIIDAINKAIKEGKIKNRAGKEIKEKIDGGLIREDKKYLYPIKEDIPIMLIDEAIPLDNLPI